MFDLRVRGQGSYIRTGCRGGVRSHPTQCRTGKGGVLIPENNPVGSDNGPGARKGRPYEGDDRPEC
jgi:hypothetical protein